MLGYHDAIFWLLALAIIAHRFWLENKWPHMRRSPAVALWRKLGEDINKPRTEVDNWEWFTDLFRKFKNFWYEVAKWILTLVAIEAAAQSTNNWMLVVLSAMLTGSLSIYMGMRANYWFNTALLEERAGSSRWRRLTSLAVAGLCTLSINSEISSANYRIVHAIIESVSAAKREPEKEIKPPKKPDVGSWV